LDIPPLEYRNVRQLIPALAFLSSVFTLLAQEPLTPTEFGKSSIAEAEKAVRVAALNPTLLAGYAAAAVESRRPELAAFCFENPQTNHAFDFAVSKLPNSPYKEELMLMMLRSGVPFWAGLSEIGRFPGHLNIDKTSAPFRALIEKYLPDMPLDDGLISTREARSRLADRIEATRSPQCKGELEPKATDVATENASQERKLAPPTSRTPVATEAPLKPAAPPEQTGAVVVEHTPPPWLWVVGIAALVIIAAVALKRRRNRLP
jgi:hypothetical protein